MYDGKSVLQGMRCLQEQQQQGQIGTSMVVVLTQSSEISTLIKAHGMDAVSPDAFVKLLPVQQRALLWPYLPAGRADYHLPEWHQLVNAARTPLPSVSDEATQSIYSLACWPQDALLCPGLASAVLHGLYELAMACCAVSSYHYTVLCYAALF